MNLMKRPKGQSLIEFMLVVACIAITCFLCLSNVGQSIKNLFNGLTFQ